MTDKPEHEYTITLGVDADVIALLERLYEYATDDGMSRHDFVKAILDNVFREVGKVALHELQELAIEVEGKIKKLDGTEKGWVDIDKMISDELKEMGLE